MRIVSRLHDVFVHRPQPSATMRSLTAEAQTTASPSNAWRPNMPPSDVRNAHVTNNPTQLDVALRGNFNCFEGDVRLTGTVRPLPGYSHRPVITAHDPLDTDGFTLQEWLRIGMASGRGLKLDIKEACAVPEILRQLQAFSVPGERLILCGGTDVGDGTRPHRLLKQATHLAFRDSFTLRDFQAMRAAYPSALIQLSPSTSRLTDAECDRLGHDAQQIGGRIMFPLRAQDVTAPIVARLKPFGQIAIWNDPKTWKPGDVAAATQSFRDMGVDGIIDLRN